MVCSLHSIKNLILLAGFCKGIDLPATSPTETDAIDGTIDDWSVTGECTSATGASGKLER